MNTFSKDENNQEVLLSTENAQIMMEWEKPYMEKSIDFLNPKGDVLEIGFGCGYSATQIMKYPIKSYTIIECDDTVINKIKEWRKNYPKIPINIVKGTWQEKISTLGKFDEIYFDDFPLNINKKSSNIEILLSFKRIFILLDLCIQNNMKIGSKISCYLNENQELSLPSNIKPFVKIDYKSTPIKIPDTCKYRDVKKQTCLIPLITKVKEYNFSEANNHSQLEINKILKETLKRIPSISENKN